MNADWIEQFPGLTRLEPAPRDVLTRKSAVVTVCEGTVIFGPGKSPENLLLLLEGRVRVQQVSEAGREIVLYRVEAGQSCVLTTACLLAHEDYSAEGIAETDVRAVAIRGQCSMIWLPSPSPSGHSSSRPIPSASRTCSRSSRT